MRARPFSGKLRRTPTIGKSFLYDTPPRTLLTEKESEAVSTLTSSRSPSPTEIVNPPNQLRISNFCDNLLYGLLIKFSKSLIMSDLPNLRAQGLNKLLQFSNGHALTLEKYLDSGVHGIIYLAKYDTRFFAVKQIKKTSDSLNEITIMQKLKKENAPNVIEYYLSPQSLNYFFIIMEFAENGSLTDLIQKTSTPLSWQIRYEALSRGIIRAIAFIHTLNIIHRDIKSSNIFITHDLQPKLGDFGFAIQEGNQIGKYIGSPLWAAPEILSNNMPNSFASDIYSASTVLLQIAAWKNNPNKIKENVKVNELRQFIITEKKREPIPADCPPKLAKLITWGWQHNPTDRPTAAQLEHELNSPINELSTELSQLTF